MAEEKDGFTDLTHEELFKADYESLTDKQKKVRDRINFLTDFLEDVYGQYEIESKVGDIHLDKNLKSRKFKALQTPLFCRIMWNKENKKDKEIEIYSTSKGYEIKSPNNKDDFGNMTYNIWDNSLKKHFPSWKKFTEQFNFKFSRKVDSIRKNPINFISNAYETIEILSDIYDEDFTETELEEIKNFKPAANINIISELPAIMRILRRHGIIKPWQGSVNTPYIVNTSGYEIYDLWKRFFRKESGGCEWNKFAEYFEFKISPQSIYDNFYRRKERLPLIVLHEIKKYLSFEKK